jgi:Domain of unknown function (DUF4136)
MRLTIQITFLAAFLLSAVCAYGQDVHYNYDRGANFAAYKTYQWVEIPGGAVPDQLIDQAIMRAADEQLRLRGLTKVESNADLYIGYQVVINLEKSVSLWGTSDGPGWGDGGWGTRSVQGQTSTVPVGILLIDLYDVGKKQLVWRGDAIKTIELKTDPDKNYKNLQKVMAKLFKNYPPKASKLGGGLNTKSIGGEK